MSEMLANQYFLSRNFDKALLHFEEVIKEEPDNECVQKKMIICYCEVGMVQTALQLFDHLIQKNIELIVDTDVISEDCPCPELVERMKWYEQVASTSYDFNCILGILNLYCNIDDSIFYFSRALELSPENQILQQILRRIKRHADERTKI